MTNPQTSLAACNFCSANYNGYTISVETGYNLSVAGTNNEILQPGEAIIGTGCVESGNRAF